MCRAVVFRLAVWVSASRNRQSRAYDENYIGQCLLVVCLVWFRIWLWMAPSMDAKCCRQDRSACFSWRAQSMGIELCVRLCIYIYMLCIFLFIYFLIYIYICKCKCICICICICIFIHSRAPSRLGQGSRGFVFSCLCDSVVGAGIWCWQSCANFCLLKPSGSCLRTQRKQTPANSCRLPQAGAPETNSLQLCAGCKDVWWCLLMPLCLSPGFRYPRRPIRSRFFAHRFRDIGRSWDQAHACEWYIGIMCPAIYWNGGFASPASGFHAPRMTPDPTVL